MVSGEDISLDRTVTSAIRESLFGQPLFAEPRFLEGDRQP